MDNDKYLKIAREAFKILSERFPALQFEENEDEPVEINIDIPVQQGLKYSVNLNLQNRDELHFSVENFWLEWFPCTYESKVNEYIDAVSGFLSGRYRILEHYRGNKCVKAELQSPDNQGWKTIGSSVHLNFLFFRKKYTKEIRNS